jgi:hypothetical protein
VLSHFFRLQLLLPYHIPTDPMLPMATRFMEVRSENISPTNYSVWQNLLLDQQAILDTPRPRILVGDEPCKAGYHLLNCSMGFPARLGWLAGGGGTTLAGTFVQA